MQKPSSSLALAALAVTILTPAPLSLMAQTTPPHTPVKAVTPQNQTDKAPTHKASTHKPGTAKSGTTSGANSGTPLPKNIPAVPGIPKSIYALRYIDIKPGTGAAAEPGWLYSVHYTGWLYDGTKFDSSLDRGAPIEFPQGRRQVISGWDTGFEGMKVGGKRRLFIPYQLAYGEQGRSSIPPKANLIFDIELVDQRDPNAPKPAPATPTPAPPVPATPAPAPTETTPPDHHSITTPTPKPE